MYTQNTFENTIYSTCRHCLQRTQPCRKCSKCRMVAYCSVECQKVDRPRHKDWCFPWESLEKNKNDIVVYAVGKINPSSEEYNRVYNDCKRKYLNPKDPENLILPSNIRFNAHAAGGVTDIDLSEYFRHTLLEISLDMNPSLVDGFLDMEHPLDEIVSYMYRSDHKNHYGILNNLLKRGFPFSLTSRPSRGIFGKGLKMEYTTGQLCDLGYDPNVFISDDWVFGIWSTDEQNIVFQTVLCGLDVKGMISYRGGRIRQIDYLKEMRPNLHQRIVRELLCDRKVNIRQLLLDLNIIKDLVEIIMGYLSNEI